MEELALFFLFFVGSKSVKSILFECDLECFRFLSTKFYIKNIISFYIYLKFNFLLRNKYFYEIVYLYPQHIGYRKFSWIL